MRLLSSTLAADFVAILMFTYNLLVNGRGKTGFCTVDYKNVGVNTAVGMAALVKWRGGGGMALRPSGSAAYALYDCALFMIMDTSYYTSKPIIL